MKATTPSDRNLPRDQDTLRENETNRLISADKVAKRGAKIEALELEEDSDAPAPIPAPLRLKLGAAE